MTRHLGKLRLKLRVSDTVAAQTCSNVRSWPEIRSSEDKKTFEDKIQPLKQRIPSLIEEDELKLNGPVRLRRTPYDLAGSP